MKSGIYEITNAVNGKRYIGSAVSFAGRFSGHRSRLRKGTHHNSHLQNAWNRYGESNFSFRPVLICSRENLVMYEQAVIDAMTPEYNLSPTAGNTLGFRFSAESRAKIAAKALGRKRSPESVERAAAKRRGVPLAPEHAAKLIGNKHAVGHRHTEEWKAANSARNIGVKRPKDAAYRAKIAATLTGRKATAEHRSNQSAAQKGRKLGPYKPMSTEKRASITALRAERKRARLSVDLNVAT